MTDELGAFAPPDWDAPLDVDGVFAGIPEYARTRGLHLQQLVDTLRERGAPCDDLPEYAPLATYPMREYIALLHGAASALYPDVPLRQALRQLGDGIYLAFTATTVGSAIFSLAEHDFRKVAKLAPTAYASSYTVGMVEVESQGKGNLEVRFREIWPFADSFQVGVWESSMRVCGANGRIWTRPLSPCDVDLEIVWDE